MRVEVTKITKWSFSGQQVHNLTVADLHTYYVRAGAALLLVHNAGPCSRRAGDVSSFEPSHGVDEVNLREKRKWSNKQLLESFNNPPDGQYVLVKPDGRIMQGHHRIAELNRRVKEGLISPDARVRIDEYRPHKPVSGFWD
jgi:hypothetical protein